MLAGVLALCCLAILLLESASRGKARYARIGAGAAASRSGLCWVKGPLWRAATASAAGDAGDGVPLLVLCRWLWLGGIDNWLHADLWHSLRQTLLLGRAGRC